MKFIKYNLTKGKSAKSGITSSINTTLNNPTVDLSGIYSRLNDNEASISDLNRQVSWLNNIANGLDNKYLRKDKGDNTDYTLSIGTARSNNFVSNKYDTTGIGFLLAETGSSSENPNYTLILSGLGNGCTLINSKSVLLDELVMNFDTVYNQKIILRCSNCFTLSTTTTGAYALIDAGFTCGNNYQIIDESLYMNYYLSMSLTGAPPVNPPTDNYGTELEKQGNYWKVPLATNGRSTIYDFTYVVKYNYIAPNDSASVGLPINLYILGTNTTTTDFYGGLANKLVATPDYLQLTSNGAGIRITSQGIFRMDSQGNMTLLL